MILKLRRGSESMAKEVGKATFRLLLAPFCDICGNWSLRG